MADLLEHHLEEKGEEHSALEMLVNQWGFDQQLIPKALQTIGSVFPHYSRHDESHSKQILINIERLLGDNVKLLTATDTWLLLEAAYWHDIGMVVPQSDLEETLENDDFKQYIESIRNSPHHDLREFCESFDFKNTSRCFAGAATPIDAVDKFRQLMAEWFRRQHAHRAHGIIQSPWESIGIRSPRTELIPSRLYRILGRICEMHGSSFSELLGENGLPFREAGLANEDCHPRFVACLLRMGDLLDLDDNRFCPVMQRIAGDDRPRMSKAHEDKHSAIRHLRIDREYIEISAECSSIDGYVEAFKWFDWLKQEMQDQMANWQRIVPSRELGLLPTLGTVSVRLRGELQILSEGNRPQFSIDAERAKELLQGSNLYNNRYACVRELLQNAVDATLLRLWLSKGSQSDDFEWQTPFSEIAQKTLGSASIYVELTEKTSISTEGKSDWILTITDEGTGISLSDLVHMLRIGGSQSNVERQKRILSMPEWMKPSGTFGIGFQSVFLICDEVKIITKSIFSGETLSIVMHSPTKSKEGLVLLKKIENDISQQYGTKIVLEFSLDTDDHSRMRPRWDNENTIAQRVAFSFDPVLDERVTIGAAELADKIYGFGKNSPINVFGNMKTADGKHSVAIGKQAAEDTLGSWRFLKIGEHQLRIRYKPTLKTSRRYEDCSFYYRGQKFEAYVYTPCGEVEVDLMSGKAGRWLNASRDALAAKASETFTKLVLTALVDVVTEDLKGPSQSEWMKKENRPAFSFFLRAMARSYDDGVWGNLALQLGDEWCDILSPDKVNSLRHYLSKEKIIFAIGSYESVFARDDNNALRLDAVSGDLFLQEWVKDPRRTISVVGSEETVFPDNINEQYYILKSSPQDSYSKSGLASLLIRAHRLTFANTRCLMRLAAPEWSGLFLRDNVKVQASDLFRYMPGIGGRVLLPFLYRISGYGTISFVEVPSLDTLCAWVKPNLISEISIDEIKRLYEELIIYLDNDIMKRSIYRDSWWKYRQLPNSSEDQTC